MTSSEPPNWKARLLAVLGANPNYKQGVRLFTAWRMAEGGSAAWNPLNTMFQLNRSTNYNTAGVQNYGHPIDGVCATALTLANGYYTGILGALQGGLLTAEQIVERHGRELDVWGTGAAHVAACLATMRQRGE